MATDRRLMCQPVFLGSSSHAKTRWGDALTLTRSSILPSTVMTAAGTCSEAEGEAGRAEEPRTIRWPGELGSDAHVPYNARRELESKPDLRTYDR